jgi:uncharacterized protein (TIGR02217 family)
MAFHEVRFPTNISYGSRGGPGYSTNIITQDSGSEERVSRWENAKRKYDVSFGIRHPEDLHAVIGFFIARMGSAYGFRYKDWIDYATTPSGNTHLQRKDGTAADVVTALDHELGVGGGGIDKFQLCKRYISGPGLKIRYITKPVAGTVKVAVDGVEVSNWTVNNASGEVLFTPAPAPGSVITAGCEFDVPVRFGKEVDEGALQAGLDDFGKGGIDSIPLIEDPSSMKVVEDGYCGGAEELCLNANFQLSAGLARAYVFTTNVAGLAAFLPDLETVPTGGPAFFLINGGPNSIAIKTFGGGTTLVTLGVNDACILFVTVDGTGAKRWYLV